MKGKRGTVSDRARAKGPPDPGRFLLQWLYLFLYLATRRGETRLGSKAGAEGEREKENSGEVVFYGRH